MMTSEHFLPKCRPVKTIAGRSAQKPIREAAIREEVLKRCRYGQQQIERGRGKGGGAAGRNGAAVGRSGGAAGRRDATTS